MRAICPTKTAAASAEIRSYEAIHQRMVGLCIGRGNDSSIGYYCITLPVGIGRLAWESLGLLVGCQHHNSVYLDGRNHPGIGQESGKSSPSGGWEMTAIYLSGPMTGLPDYNYPAFNEAAAQLRQFGFRVLNPAEIFGGDMTRSRSEYLKADLLVLIQEAELVVTLPEWEQSAGARLEVEVAFQLGLPVKHIDKIMEMCLQSRQFQAA